MAKLELAFINNTLREHGKIDITIKGFKAVIRNALAGHYWLSTVEEVRVPARNAERRTMGSREVGQVSGEFSSPLEKTRSYFRMYSQPVDTLYQFCE